MSNRDPEEQRSSRGRTFAYGERVDPRVQDTRDRLMESLLELTIERGYGKTRIRDILERAAVARSTFYSHYKDKDDLFIGRFHLFRVYPVHGVEADGTPKLPDVERLFAHAAMYRDLYESLAASGDAELPLRKAARDMRAGYTDVFEDLVARGHELSGEPTLLAQFVTGAFMAVLTDWLERGAPEPARELAVRFQGLVRRAMTP